MTVDFDTRPRKLNGPFVKYDEEQAKAWLDSPNNDGDNPTGRTIAEYYCLDDEAGWPIGDDDEDCLVWVLHLIERALSDGVIALDGTAANVELIETRCRDGILTGSRLLIETHGGMTLANGGPIWTSDYTGDTEPGREAALNTLWQAAYTVHAVLRHYTESDVL